MDTKAMTAERLADLLSKGRSIKLTGLEIDELSAEVHRLRAVEERAKVLHKAVQTLDEMAGELMLTLKHDELCQIRLAAPHLTVVCDCGASKAKEWIRTLRQYTMDIARAPAAPSFLEDGT